MLKPLPAGPYRTVLKLERRVSHEGMVSVGGNLYSVPDATRRRVLEVHRCGDEIRIFEAGRLVAVHAVLEGRHRRVAAAGRRHLEQLNMPRALETLDATLRSVEQGELSALAALEQLLGRGTHHARDAAHQDRPNDRAARLA
ncbi:MAG: putative insertion sequence transposase protein [Rhodospirillaceae bacterium]|nr:MAG: putative insertion sequence transposase protein [Rhodospirillaceae bacterium]